MRHGPAVGRAGVELVRGWMRTDGRGARVRTLDTMSSKDHKNDGPQDLWCRPRVRVDLL